MSAALRRGKGGIDTAGKRKKPTTAQIRESLYAQLRAKEADVSHFADLVEEYMDFLRLEKKLAKDIERRGINYPERMSTGIEKIVNNPSIKDLVSVSKQKQIILEKLGITTEKMVSADGDEL